MDKFMAVLILIGFFMTSATFLHQDELLRDKITAIEKRASILEQKYIHVKLAVLEGIK